MESQIKEFDRRELSVIGRKRDRVTIDQLDALFKLRHNNNANDSNAIDAAILAVNKKYPKPPAPIVMNS